MRVIAVIVLAIMGLVGQGQVSSAQSTAPAKTGAAPGVARIGTLSPDEARRAARARKRAASAGKVLPAPVAAAPAPIVKVHKAAAAPPMIKTPSARQPDAAAGPKGRRLAQEHPDAAAGRPRVVDRRHPSPGPDVRRAHLRMQAPPPRRVYAHRPRRGPQVGDVVPDRVPLYRAQPRYEPYYPEGPVYVPAGPPAYEQPDFPPYPGTPEGY